MINLPDDASKHPVTNVCDVVKVHHWSDRHGPQYLQDNTLTSVDDLPNSWLSSLIHATMSSLAVCPPLLARARLSWAHAAPAVPAAPYKPYIHGGKTAMSHKNCNYSKRYLSYDPSTLDFSCWHFDWQKRKLFSFSTLTVLHMYYLSSLEKKNLYIPNCF